MSESTDITEIRTAVRQLCAQYGEDYWLELDRTRGYPTEFVSELTKSGFLTVLIPENYGGAGVGVFETSVIMEEVCRAGAPPGAGHAEKDVMGAVPRGGGEARENKDTPPPDAGVLSVHKFRGA